MIDAFSKLFDVSRDDEFYTHLLSSVIVMQQADFAQKIWAQSSFDNLKETADYGIDAVTIASSLAGLSGECASFVSDLVSIVTDGAELLLDIESKVRTGT